MKHLNILKILDFVLAGLTGLATLFLLLGVIAMIALGVMAGDFGSVLIGVIAMGVGFVVCLVIAVLFFLAGKKVQDGNGRILQTILALTQISNVPLGTAYGAYAIWVCWINVDTKELFDSQ